MEQIVDSINVLVGVARQSHQTQQINMLHRHQKELEDSIQTFDGAFMELELHLLEASGMRKQVFEHAFPKNAEISEKKKELEVTTQMLTNRENRTTLTQTTMPWYVNADGSKSVESNND